MNEPQAPSLTQSRRFLDIMTRFRELHPLLAAAILAASLALVSALDLLTGPDFSVSLFYYFCVAFGALTLGRFKGLAAAILTALLATGISLAAGKQFPSTGHLMWSFGIRAANFSLLVALLYRMQLLVGQLREQTLRDPLTQAANRRYFEEYLAQIIRQGMRQTMPLTIAFFDVDDFKAINDRLGHARGDLVLTTIARSIQAQIRPGDILARYGGDEFILVLQGIPADVAKDSLARIFQKVQSEFAEWPRTIGLSIGAVSYRKIPDDANVLLARVDALMYEVKKSGKGSLLHIQA